MEILNIGPLELILFLVIAFLLLGPKGMVLTAYKIGQWIRQAVRSPMWREILRSAQDIRELPQKIMEDTGLEEELNNIRAETTAAMNEVNTSLKEVDSTMKQVQEEARVPDAEHIRLETTAGETLIRPAASTVPASGTTYPPPVYGPAPEGVLPNPLLVEGQNPTVENAAEPSLEAPAVVETVLLEPIEPAAQDLAPAVVVTTGDPPAEPAAAPKRARASRKKAAPESAPAPDPMVPVQVQPAVEVEGTAAAETSPRSASKTSRARPKPKSNGASAQAAPEPALPLSQVDPAAAPLPDLGEPTPQAAIPEPKPPRKKSVRKKAPAPGVDGNQPSAQPDPSDLAAVEGQTAPQAEEVP